MSTDYSSTESLDAASQEHAEALLRIVTPPHFGEGSESSGSEDNDEHGEGEMGIQGTGGSGEEKGVEDTLTPGDCVLVHGEEASTLSDTHTSIPAVGKSSVSESHTTDSDTVQEPDSPFSTSILSLPTTPVSTPHQLAPQEEGMSWWADALAETQGMEDIDALVEQLDVAGATTTVEKELKEGDKGGGKKEEEEVSETTNGGSERGLAVSDTPWSEGQEGKTDLEETTGASSLSPPTADGGNPQSSLSIASSQESIDSVGRQKNRSTRSSRSPSPSVVSTGPAPSDNAAYIVQAGRLIRLALQYEGEQEYEEAFDLFKAAVDVLLNGVQSE